MIKLSLHSMLLKSCTLAVFSILSITSMAQPSDYPKRDDATRDESLRSRLRVLDAQFNVAARELQTLDERSAALREEVQDLLDELREMETASKPAPAKSVSNAKKVVYRPPLERVTRKRPAAVIVCEANRLTIFDVGSMKESLELPRSEIQKLLESRKDVEGKRMIPNEHFDIWYSIKIRKSSRALDLDPEVRLIRKSGKSHRGETVEESTHTDSELRERLLKFDPNTTFIQFVVYPDSYDAFRAVRSIVWQRGFEVFWIPLLPDEAIPFGSGPAISL